MNIFLSAEVEAPNVEEFLAREGDGGDGGAEPGMPTAAGGAL